MWPKETISYNEQDFRATPYLATVEGEARRIGVDLSRYEFLDAIVTQTTSGGHLEAIYELAPIPNESVSRITLFTVFVEWDADGRVTSQQTEVTED